MGRWELVFHHRAEGANRKGSWTKVSHPCLSEKQTIRTRAAFSVELTEGYCCLCSSEGMMNLLILIGCV